MANRFKDYREKLKSNKTVILSDDEVNLYSKTSNNEGVSHVNADWIISAEKPNDAESAVSEKEKTILRNAEREQKAKETTENLSEK